MQNYDHSYIMSQVSCRWIYLELGNPRSIPKILQGTFLGSKYWSVSLLWKYARCYEVKKQTGTTSGINTGL